MHTKLQSKDDKDIKKVEKQLSKMVIDKKRNKNMDYDSDYWEFVIEGEDEEMVEEGEGEGEENIEKMGGVFHRILSMFDVILVVSSKN